ncbi:armadillo-type protein [Paraphysoderma sedebokerense]|nr:armadillo-type protein [Paraphysoderma sedebokerense]
MDAATLSSIDQVCSQLYNPTSNQDRLTAERILAYSFPSFADSPLSATSPPSPVSPDFLRFTASKPSESVIQTRAVLQSTTNPYTQLFTATHLKSLITNHYSILTIEERLELKNAILEYLFSRPNLETFVATVLSQSYALLIKLGWFDHDDFRTVVDNVNTFIHATIDQQIMGLQILSSLVSELNFPSQTVRSNKHRKAVVGFRDTQLFQVFNIGIGFIQKIVGNALTFENPNQEGKIKEATMSLIKACLTFDFIGTSPDESSDDVGAIQIPGVWKSTIDSTVISTFFNAYRLFQPSNSSIVMECISYLVSIRRSLFPEKDRKLYVSAIMKHTIDVIQNSRGTGGLNVQENFHEFCRMLSRFKSTYPNNEVTEKDEFMEWIEKIAEFTVEAIRSWQWSPNSIQYLLTFWSKVATSSSSSTGTGSSITSKLEFLSAEVSKAYIASKIEAVEEIVRDELDDPLEDEDSLSVGLELLANFSRLSYSATTAFLLSSLNPIASMYQNIIQMITSDVNVGISRLQNDSNLKLQLRVLEDKLTWGVYFVGSFIGARVPYTTPDTDDTLDGDLTCKVLHLLRLHEHFTNTIPEQYRSERLDLSFIFFFQMFRKSYIGENSHKKVYGQLADDWGVTDQGTMMSLIVERIGTNLKVWADKTTVITKTLKLFEELSAGYSSLKLLSKTPASRAILHNHSSPYFQFLAYNSNAKNREKYYSTLCRILFNSDDCDEEFETFVKGWEDKLDKLISVNDLAVYRGDDVKQIVVGLFRDLRGFVSSIMTKKSFMSYHDDPVVTNIVLKFHSEFVFNRTQRMNFEVSSPNAVSDRFEYVFWSRSSVLTGLNVGQSIVPLQVPDNQKYDRRYKGMSICFQILRNSLSGQYVNFGVFPLYGDKALEDAFNMFFDIILSIPLEDMMSFPKLSRSYFCLLETFSQDQLPSLLSVPINSTSSPSTSQSSPTPTIPTQALLYICRTLSEGLKSLDCSVNTQSAASIDYIASHVFQFQHGANARRKKSKSGLALFFGSVDRNNPMESGMVSGNWTGSGSENVLPYWLMLILMVVIFEDTQIQWTLSRPLLPLVLLCRDYFHNFVNIIINAQLPERREKVASLLSGILTDIEMNLTSKNRDKLTNNISNFRRDVVAQAITLIFPTEWVNVSCPF